MNPREQWQKVRETDVKVTLPLGPNTVDRYLGDPKRISFMLARYAFAAKMLQDKTGILDVGCGDGFGTLTFLNETSATIEGVDFDQTLIDYALGTLIPAVQSAGRNALRIGFRCANFIEAYSGYHVDGISCLDVIEHLDPSQSYAFLSRINLLLGKNGIAVIGTPNEHAAHLQSEHSRIGHINNFTPDRLRADLLSAGFSNVLMFGMNDCTLHTGHPHLWHYILAVAVKS